MSAVSKPVAVADARKLLFPVLTCFCALAVVFVSACSSRKDFEVACLGIAAVASIAAVFWMLRASVRWLEARDVFAPWIGFPIAYVLWFAIGCSLPLFGGAPQQPSPPYAAMVLALLCYFAGTLVAHPLSHYRQIPFGHFRDEWSAERFRVLAEGVAVVSVCAYLLIAIQMGIPGVHLSAGVKRLNLIRYGKSQSIFLYGASTLLIFLATRLWRKGATRASKFKATAAIVVLSLLILSLGSRGNLLMPLVTVLIARHYLRRKTPLVNAASLAAVIFVVASVAGWARDMMVYSSRSGSTLRFDPTSLYYLYFYVTNTVTTLSGVVAEIPRWVPYQHGYLSFGALASLLPGHHVSSDMFFRKILGGNFVGFGQPATLLGPMYGDFGFPGIAVQMFALGVFYVCVYRWMRARPTVFRGLIYAWVSQTVLFSLFGSLFTYIGTLLIPVAWIFFNQMLRRPDKSVGGPAFQSTGSGR